jgi:hypothetical protein
MSACEKHQPEPDAKCKITSWTGVLKAIFGLTLATGSIALGFASTTRIAPNDSYLESVVKLFPVFGAAILIHAVFLHASLLRAVWNGRFPGDKASHGWKLSISNCYAITLKDWRHLVGFHMSALLAPGGYHSLWWALSCAREVGERARPLKAASAAEKGHAATAKSTSDNSHAPNKISPRLTTVCMLVLSFAGFRDLASALLSGTIETALSFFGPCFLTALMVAALMLRVATLLPNILHGSNRSYLVFAYRCGGLIVFPCACTALEFATWYCKGRPLYPGV